MHLRDELLRGLSPEQIDKVNSCNSAIEVLALAKDKEWDINVMLEER